MPEFAEVVLNLPINRAFTYRIPPELQAVVRPGVRVRVPFRTRQESGTVVRLTDRTDFPAIKDIDGADPEAAVDAPLLDLALWMAARYGCSWGEAVEAVVPAGVKKARRARSPAEADALAGTIVEKKKQIRLTSEQEAALAAVAEGGVTLLHGVTGSGKTEVYLRALSRIVAQGKQAIVLVPEISLTPQTVSRFKARFPRVAVLHSMLAEGDRAAQWRAVRAGAVDVVVGARSAVFAPTKALGLIVLDEEHEGSYKQENAPRYHARDVAIERARREGAAVILGSATPSLESWHRAQTGEYRLARLTRRIEGREMPEIEVVDMTAEKADTKRSPVISRLLEQRMRQSLGQGEQVILFLNRRGFITHFSCPRCRWFFRCERCDVAMTYHKEGEQAMCHYCLRTAPLPGSCPGCGGAKLLQYGIGTERIESDVKRLFPGYRVSRMDSDSMKSRKDYRESIGAFWKGETDILIGTQMIAKGMDVPDVTLVGVVNADTAFHIPDFRAAERTFQTITQVAGRTGRGPLGGRVVVQTFHPQHYALKAAVTYDFTGFMTRELNERRDLGYPPFTTLIRLVVQASNGPKVHTTADRLGEKLRKAFPEEQVKILGPAIAPLYRIKGKFRVHFLLKTAALDAVLPSLREIAASFSKPRVLQVILDVDPLSLL